jgi:hypothetical protein
MVAMMSALRGAKTLSIKALMAAALVAASWSVQAAGGHHAVDDARMLDQNKCVAEGWVADGDATLLHLGASCGTGWVELGLSAEHSQSLNSDSDIPSETGLQAKAKWAHAFDDEVSLGASYTLGLNANDVMPKYAVSRMNGLFTWSPNWNDRHEYTVHLNLGQDFVNGEGFYDDDDAPDKNFVRWGGAFEWAPDPNLLPSAMTGIGNWSFIAERFKEFDANYLRLGFRITFGGNGSFDVSREQGLDGSNEGARWFFGVTVPLEINY